MEWVCLLMFNVAISLVVSLYCLSWSNRAEVLEACIFTSRRASAVGV